MKWLVKLYIQGISESDRKKQESFDKSEFLVRIQWKRSAKTCAFICSVFNRNTTSEQENWENRTYGWK